MEYLVVVEQGRAGYGAYVPDLPGCVATADTKDEVLALIQEAIVLHLELMQEDGLPKRTLGCHQAEGIAFDVCPFAQRQKRHHAGDGLAPVQDARTLGRKLAGDAEPL